MTNEEAIKMLSATIKCIERESSGTDIDCNLRNCDECELCYAQGTTVEQRESLTVAISALTTIDQVLWERNLAIEQLKGLGYGLGEKPREDGTDTNVGDMINREELYEELNSISLPVGDETVDKIFSVIENIPSAQPEISRIEQELHGKTPEEQYEFLYWLLLKFGLAYTDSRLAVIEWLRGEKEDE